MKKKCQDKFKIFLNKKYDEKEESQVNIFKYELLMDNMLFIVQMIKTIIKSWKKNNRNIFPYYASFSSIRDTIEKGKKYSFKVHCESVTKVVLLIMELCYY